MSDPLRSQSSLPSIPYLATPINYFPLPFLSIKRFILYLMVTKMHTKKYFVTAKGE